VAEHDCGWLFPIVRHHLHEAPFRVQTFLVRPRRIMHQETEIEHVIVL
jgi:hypothetical protein